MNPRGRAKNPISREEALALSKLARELMPVGSGPTFDASAAQLRAARAGAKLSIDAMAAITGLTPATISNVEGGINADRGDRGKMRAVLENHGALFVRQGGIEAVAFRA